MDAGLESLCAIELRTVKPNVEVVRVPHVAIDSDTGASDDVLNRRQER